MIWTVAVLLLLLLASIGGLIAYVRRRTIPIESASDLLPIFGALLSTADPRGHVFIRVERGPESLQFYRRAISGQKAYLSLEFPVALWSEPYQEQIRKLAAESGFEVVQRDLDRPATTVHCGDDLDRVSSFVWRVLSQTYRAVPNRRIRAFLLFDGPSEGLSGSTNQVPL